MCVCVCNLLVQSPVFDPCVCMCVRVCVCAHTRVCIFPTLFSMSHTTIYLGTANEENVDSFREMYLLPLGNGAGVPWALSTLAFIYFPNAFWPSYRTSLMTFLPSLTNLLMELRAFCEPCVCGFNFISAIKETQRHWLWLHQRKNAVIVIWQPVCFCYVHCESQWWLILHHYLSPGADMQ